MLFLNQEVKTEELNTVNNLFAHIDNEFEAVRSTKKYCSIECQNASRREKYANKEKNQKEILPEYQWDNYIFTP